MDDAPWWTADYALSPYWPVAAALVGIAAIATLLRSGRGRHGWALAGIVLAWGVVMAATLTPIPRAARDCAFALSASSWLSGSGWSLERVLNVALFVPLGVAVWLARHRLAMVVAVVLSPFVIEAVQAGVSRGGRDCDANDVVANLLGVTIGLVIGAVGVAVLGAPRDGGAPESDGDG